MKFRFVVLFSFAFSQVAWSSPKDECAKYLAVPEQFADQFEIYSKLHFATPLTDVSLARSKNDFVTLRLASTYRPDTSLVEPPEVNVTVVLESENGIMTMKIQDMKMAAILPPEMTWRMVLAHLLDLAPDTKEIHHSFYHDSDDARIRGLLIEGVPAHEAVRQSAAYRAMNAFGFHLKAAKAEPEPESPYQGDVGVSFEVSR